MSWLRVLGLRAFEAMRRGWHSSVMRAALRLRQRGIGMRSAVHLHHGPPALHVFYSTVRPSLATGQCSDILDNV